MASVDASGEWFDPIWNLADFPEASKTIADGIVFQEDSLAFLLTVPYVNVKKLQISGDL